MCRTATSHLGFRLTAASPLYPGAIEIEENPNCLHQLAAGFVVVDQITAAVVVIVVVGNIATAAGRDSAEHLVATVEVVVADTMADNPVATAAAESGN